MEFFLQFFFQFRVLSAWPLADRYHLLTHLWTPRYNAFRWHIFSFSFYTLSFHFFISFHIYIYRFTSNQLLNQLGIAVIGIDSQTVDLRCSYRDSSSTWNVNPVTKRSSRIKWTSLTRGWGRGEGEGEGEQTNKGKTKTRERSRSLFLGRVVLAYSWHVSRVLSPLFQIRNTLGAEGFPISPSFIARVSGYHHHYGIRRETQRGRDAIQPRRRRVYVF